MTCAQGYSEEKGQLMAGTKRRGGGAPQISVIIPALNEERYVGRALRSLLDQSLERSEYEIIVVDGHSTDGTVAVSRKLADRVIFEGIGTIGGARNVGARAASGEIVAFIDADSVAPRNWLMRIRKTFRNAKLVGLGGMAYPIRGRMRDKFAFLAMNSYCKLASWAGIYQFLGYNCAYRRREFLAAGGFDGKLHFLEDSEFSLRLGARSKKCKFSRRLCIGTSPRRLVQQGVMKAGARVLVGYWKLFSGKKIPWDGYSGEVSKAGRELDR